MTEEIRTDENLVEEVSNIGKLFTGSEERPLTDEQKAAIAKIAEIARTTENPEVLTLCSNCVKGMINNIYRSFSMEYNRGKDPSRKIPIINCLSAIAENTKIKPETLEQCMCNIKAVFNSTSLFFKFGEKSSENKEYTASIFNCLVKIIKNPKFKFSYPLDYIVTIGRNHPNEEIKKMVIKELLAITINRSDILPIFASIKHIQDVANTISEDKTKKEIINEIDENEESDAIKLKCRAIAIGGIAVTLKDKVEKMGFINNISEIVENENSDADTLAGCAIAIGEIAATLKDQEEKKIVINVLSKIIQNEKSNHSILCSCGANLKNIIETLEDEETKKSAIKTLLGIYMHKNYYQFDLDFPIQNYDQNLLLNIANLQDESRKELISFIATEQAEQAVNVDQLDCCKKAICFIAGSEVYLKTYHLEENKSLEEHRWKSVEIINKKRKKITTETTSENFLSPQQPTGGDSTKVNAAIAAAAAVSVDTMKRPRNPLVVETNTFESAAKKARTSDGNSGQGR